MVEAEADASAQWSASSRLGYSYVPYGRLQSGRAEVENLTGLGIDVHLGTLQAQVGSPLGLSLELQLPFGALASRSGGTSRTDSGVGDLELRLRQSLRALGVPSVRVGAGLVLPTGDYSARSGAANLAPEASYLTLGRGTAWWLADVEAAAALGARASLWAQLSGRGPLGRTDDGFAWGKEARAVLGGRLRTPWPRVTALLSSELQWRGGASEPDPFSGGRTASANAGGWQWSASPAIGLALGQGLTLAAGLRVPLIAEVTGRQLVPQVGTFLGLSYSYAAAPRRAAPTVSAPPPVVAGKVTVVDYWASWCQPCHEVSRLLDEARVRWPDVEIRKVDASALGHDPSVRLPVEARGALPVVEVYAPDGARRVLLGSEAHRVVEIVDALRAEPARATSVAQEPTP